MLARQVYWNTIHSVKKRTAVDVLAEIDGYNLMDTVLATF